MVESTPPGFFKKPLLANTDGKKLNDKLKVESGEVASDIDELPHFGWDLPVKMRVGMPARYSALTASANSLIRAGAWQKPICIHLLSAGPL